jgi:hypothetical protein
VPLLIVKAARGAERCRETLLAWVGRRKEGGEAGSHDDTRGRLTSR